MKPVPEALVLHKVMFFPVPQSATVQPTPTAFSPFPPSRPRACVIRLLRSECPRSAKIERENEARNAGPGYFI